MGGFDKYLLGEKLKALGWKELNPDAEPLAPDYLHYVPPESLYKDAPTSFWIYDAEQLQHLLGQPVLEDNDPSAQEP